MLGCVREVFICSEKRQIVPDGQLCKQRINGADLDSRFPTCIAQARGTDVIVPIWLKQRQGCKAFDDPGLRLRTREPLQELLKNQPCRDHNVRSEQGIFEFLHLGFRGLNIAPKRQGPNACINEQRHFWRDRSDL